MPRHVGVNDDFDILSTFEEIYTMALEVLHP